MSGNEASEERLAALVLRLNSLQAIPGFKQLTDIAEPRLRVIQRPQAVSSPDHPLTSLSAMRIHM